MGSTRSLDETLANTLTTPDDMAAYLTAVLEDGDEADFLVALGDVTKITGMSKVAKETGLGRESMYKTLSEAGNPTLETLMLIINALDLRLAVSPSDNKAA